MQGCQILNFETKNRNLDKYWTVLQCQMYILWTFCLFYGHLMNFVAILVYFVVIWYIFPRFGIFYQEKSGNPGRMAKTGPILAVRVIEAYQIELTKSLFWQLPHVRMDLQVLVGVGGPLHRAREGGRAGGDGVQQLGL
jgi:hypothetical protein